MISLLINKDMAFDYVQKIIQKHYDAWFRRELLNHGRHLLLSPTNSLVVPKFYVLYKKDFFHKFNDHCEGFVKDNPYYRGLGESINEEFLQRAIREDALLLFVYPNKQIYSIFPMVIYKLWQNQPPHLKGELLRTQLKNNQYSIPDYNNGLKQVYELTFVFPIKLMSKLDLGNGVEV